MPSRLRPTASVTADAILVGDPGRALLLAQELLEQPKMSNHARGLWGYSGRTPAGHELTIQSTGIGGPSAALVLGELAELGVQRAIRVGTCVGLGEELDLGQLLVVTEAIAAGGSATSLGVEVGEGVRPDEDLTARLGKALGEGARRARVASFDAYPGGEADEGGVEAGDMQSAPLLARARGIGVSVGVLLIVTALPGGEIDREDLELAEKTAGRVAASALG
jgi:purine-nucleoside phosphorylase